MEKYNKYLTNIFRIDNSKLEICTNENEDVFNSGMCEFTSIKGIKCIGNTEGPIKMFTDGIGKYVLLDFYIDIPYKQYLGKTEENEGIYSNNNEQINTNYIVGTIYFINELSRNNKEYNKYYYFNFNDIVICLGTKNTTDSFLEIIDDSQLPVKIRLGDILLNGINLGGGMDISVRIIKDTVEELIKEILEEKGFNPTDKEINEIVKNSAFNSENEGKGILNPIYRTEGREVKKVKVDIKYLKPLGEGKREVNIENLD
ncbi:MAG: hypothetical protein Q8K30_05165 [Candidatus Gracilibacteria bacterium]|nr:hypothetical protein [Candidatus Gracilibacteria bacterium]